MQFKLLHREPGTDQLGLCRGRGRRVLECHILHLTKGEGSIPFKALGALCWAQGLHDKMLPKSRPHWLFPGFDHITSVFGFKALVSCPKGESNTSRPASSLPSPPTSFNACNQLPAARGGQTSLCSGVPVIYAGRDRLQPGLCLLSINLKALYKVN